MLKQVKKVCVASEPDTVYYLQVTWEKDIDSGFSLLLCDGQSAWSGTVSEEEISREASEMEMKKEKYVDELKRALALGAERADTYSFDLSKEGDGAEFLQFFYEKVLKDVSFRLGSVRLTKVQSPAEVIKELIDYGLVCIAELRAKNEHLQKENERLLSDWNYISHELEKCVDGKEKLEQELFTRFVLVLNEKKAKIRSLQEKLKEAETAVESAKLNRDDLATVRSPPAVEEDYDGSTDDESKSCGAKNSSSHAFISCRAPPASSSVDNSPHDVIDIAPSRKRRQRLQKNEGAEMKKSSKQSLQQDKERSGPVLLKSSGNPLPSERELSATENISEPEDLFENM